MLHHRHALVVLALLALCLVSPRAAFAERWLVPVGVLAAQPDADHLLCPSGSVPPGWSLDVNGRGLHAPTGADAVGQQAAFLLARTATGCAGPTEPLQVLLGGRPPIVDPLSSTLDTGARTLVVRGRGLRGTVLRWRTGTLGGTDVCAETTAAGAQESCSFALGRMGDGAELALELWPAGTPAEGAVVSFDASGHRVDSVAQLVRPARVLLSRVLPVGAALELSSGEARVPLEHPDAVASAQCVDAVCSIDGATLVVRDVRSVSDALSVQLTLRPHYFLSRDGGVDTATLVSLPVQRCPLSVVSYVPWRSMNEPRVVVRVGGPCAAGAALEFTAGAGPLTVVQSVNVDNQRYVALQLERLPVDDFVLRMRRAGAGSVLGAARGRPGAPISGRTGLEIEGLGAVDFIPTNRPARANAPTIPGSALLVPVGVEGTYEVSFHGSTPSVQAVEGATGSVAIRLALRDASLPAPLDTLDLAQWDEPVQRTMHSATVEIPLRGSRGLVELVCGNGEGVQRSVEPGITRSLPYRARSSCALVMHRERLRREDGAQRLRVQISVTDAGGDETVSARVDQRIVLLPGTEPRRLPLTGITAPFDRVTIRVNTQDADDNTSGADTQPDGLQWAIVFGTDHFRIYGAATIPTGLFRVADTTHTGILSLNTGVLFRFVYLTREGNEFPLCFEVGGLWVGITGDGDVNGARHGQAALVGGLALSVPIANRARATQTSISLHVWFEYEVSRALTPTTAANPDVGTPFGFVFGPSLSFGDVGTNF